MQIKINTDHNIEGHQVLAAQNQWPGEECPESIKRAHHAIEEKGDGEAQILSVAEVWLPPPPRCSQQVIQAEISFFYSFGFLRIVRWRRPPLFPLVELSGMSMLVTTGELKSPAQH